MRFLQTELPGVIIVEPDVHRDARGFFLETYHQRKYHEAGITLPFVQDNLSDPSGDAARPARPATAPQGKLIRVVEGEIFDVAVDIRRNSPMFGRWVSVSLSDRISARFSSPRVSPRLLRAKRFRYGGVQVHDPVRPERRTRNPLGRPHDRRRLAGEGSPPVGKDLAARPWSRSSTCFRCTRPRRSQRVPECPWS